MIARRTVQVLVAVIAAFILSLSSADAQQVRMRWQDFISGPDGVRLPPLYSHFGQVVTGLDVVEKINNVGSRSGTPTEQVVIESVTIEEKD